MASEEAHGPWAPRHWQQSVNSGASVGEDEEPEVPPSRQQGTQCQLSMKRPPRQVRQSLARGPLQVEQEAWQASHRRLSRFMKCPSRQK